MTIEKNGIEKILESAFDEMNKRYRDMLDLSYKLKDKKDNFDELMYIIDLRGEIIEQINQIQQTINPVWEILKEKSDVEIKDIFEKNIKIKNLRENIKDIILGIKIIDDEISSWMKNAQNNLKDELNKIRKSKEVNSKYSPFDKTKGGKLIDDRK